jgi:toxin ParE1/3/4
MARIVQDADAEADLVQIWFYIARDNSTAADRLLDRIAKSLELLATQPRSGQEWNELSPGIRRFAVGNYVILYRPLDDGIQVVRVLHGARDIFAAFHKHS